MASNNLTIISLNTNGLKVGNKAIETIYWCDMMKCDILLTQETHSNKDKIEEWKKIWQGEIYSSFGTNFSCGTDIWLRNKLNYKLLKEVKDKIGRYVVIEIEINEISYTIGNFYGPNKDDPKCLHEFLETVERNETTYTILGGDFNFVMDIYLDKKGGRPTTHFQMREVLKTWMEDRDMCDAWRLQNDKERKFTWRSYSKPRIYCRLDYFICNFSLLGHLTKNKIIAGYRSDHRGIMLETRDDAAKPGPGFWKFNKCLLENPEYEQDIINTIKETEELNPEADDTLLWDTMKCRIRGVSVKHSFIRSKKKKTTLKTIHSNICNLEDELSKLDEDHESYEETEKNLLQYRETLDQLIEEEAKGAAIRSKIQYYEAGEKSNKFFLNLEKQRSMKKSVNKLRTEENEIITQPDQILKEEVRYYKNLYNSRMEKDHQYYKMNEKLMRTERKKVPEDMAIALLSPYTEDEIYKIISNTGKDKSPGTDGLTTEFYIHFWKHLKKYFLRAFNNILKTGKLSISQRQGIITLIPKGDKDPNLLKNWRPLTLLNQDYKFMAKCFADRLGTILPSIISSDQTGFVEGRYIGCNLHRIFNLQQHCIDNKICGVLMSLDFEKAFDSVEWSYIYDSLGYFGIPEKFINYIKIFYHEIQSCVLNNGSFSEFFMPERGVRQGCPLSPPLFVIGAEAAANWIRSNEKIRGIDGYNSKYTISQFADDTTLALYYSSETTKEVFNTMEGIRIVSGLKINKDKTEVLALGPMIPERGDIWMKKHLKDKIKILGITVCRNFTENADANYPQIIESMKNTIQLWNRRNLSIAGKNIILKTLVLSKLYYAMQILNSPKEETLATIEKMCFAFLWDSNSEKLKRRTLIGPYNKGGFKCTDIRSQNKAFKLNWMIRLIENGGTWSDLISYKLRATGERYFARTFVKYKDILFTLPKNHVWTEIINNWCEYNTKTESIRKADILNEALWLNSNIKIQSKTVIWENWFNRGIHWISDICHYEENRYLNYTEFCTRHHFRPCFTKYYGLLAAIPKNWKKEIYMETNDEDNEEVTDKKIDILCDKERPVNYVYNELVDEKHIVPIEKLNKWKEDMNMQIEDEKWLSSIWKERLCTISSKLRSFAYKFQLRNIPYGKRLYYMKKQESKNCQHCETSEETIMHLYWNCPNATKLWQEIINLIELNQNIRGLPTPPERCRLMLSYDAGTPFQLTSGDRMLILLTKYYIHLNRCTDEHILTKKGLKRLVLRTEAIEHTIAQKNGKMEKHQQKWGNIRHWATEN